MPHSEFWPFATKVELNNDLNEEPSLLQKQLGLMEGEVKEIRMELAAIRKDRMGLLLQKRNLFGGVAAADVVTKDDASMKGCDIAAKHDDELLTVPQTGELREHIHATNNEADEERFQREKYEARLRNLEAKIDSCCVGIAPEKELPRKIVSDEVDALKNQVRDLNEEIEELKISANEKCEQLQEYRAKYLLAQQQVEELRRQVELSELDNRQVSDQIRLEIQKLKMQFEMKLQELAPLPELLQGARAELQEARQLQALAEDSSRQLAAEIDLLNDKLAVAVNGLAREKADGSKLAEENQRLKLIIDDLRTEVEQLSNNVDEFKCRTVRLEEKVRQEETRVSEKARECTRLARALEEKRAESERALGRARARGDSARRTLHAQLAELESQLVQSRAHARTCQKERDEIRQRMQLQVNNLQEGFELVEMRLHALHSQVNALRSSYALVLADEEDGTTTTL